MHTATEGPPLVRFNALTGAWEIQAAQSWGFEPITRAAAQRAMLDGVRQAPMWTGPKPVAPSSAMA